MENIEIYENPEFGKVRTTLIDGEPYFVGKDVADILGYSNSCKALLDHVDAEDKGVTKCDTLGGMQKITVINESGLYSLILGSKLPTAKKFKRWVTSEVLPSIRKTGSYSTPKMTAMEMIAELANNAVKTEKTLDDYGKRLAELEEKADINVKGIVQEALTYATLNPQQQQYIHDKIGIRIMRYCLDNKIFGDRRGLYNKIYSDLYRVFGVNTYKSLRVRDISRAAEFIDNWKP